MLDVFLDLAARRRALVNVLPLAVMLLAFSASAISQTIEPVVQHGHSASVVDVTFSPDGKLIISGDRDGTVIVWDATTGVQLKALELGDSLGDVAISPDGRWLLASTYEIKDQVHVFDMTDFSHARTIDGQAIEIRFTPDGRWLLLGDYEGVQVVEFATGRQHASIAGIDPRGSWAISRDGSVFFAPSGSINNEGIEDTLHVISIPDGRRVSSVRFESSVSTLTLSTDGTRLAAVEIRGNDWWIHELDTRTLRTRTSFRFDPAGFYPRLLYTPDAKRLLVSGEDGLIKLMDISSGRVLKTLSGHLDGIYDTALSPDGRTLISGAADRGVILWDLATWAERGRLVPRAARYSAVEFCGGGGWLALAPVVEGFPLELWNTATGIPGRMLHGHHASVHDIECAGSSFIASVGSDGDAIAWSVEAGAPVDSIPSGNYGFSGVAVSSDERLYAFVADGEMQVRDLATGSIVSRFGRFGSTYGLAFTNDGRSIVTADLSLGHVSVRAWNIANGQPGQVFFRSEKDMWPSFIRLARLATSPNGRLVAAGDITGKARVWRLGDGGLLHEWQSAPAGRGFGVNSLVEAIGFSPDSRRLAFSSLQDNSIRVADISTGREVMRMSGHGGAIVDLAYAPNGRTLISCATDFTCKIWSTTTGEELASLVRLINGDDWLAVTEQGFFDGTRAAWQLVPFRFLSAPRNLYEPEQFFNQFFEPGLVASVLRDGKSMQEILADRRDPRAALDIADYANSRMAKVSIVSPAVGTRTNAREVNVVLRAEDMGSGLRDLRVFRNNSLVHFQHGSLRQDPVTKSHRLTVPVKLVAGQNEIRAYAFNTDGVKSKDASTIVESLQSPQRKGTAYVLAIGINSYADSSYDLRYAVSDANAMIGTLGQSLERLGEYERVVAVGLLDDEATKQNIQSALTILSGGRTLLRRSGPAALHELRAAEPEDAVIVFFAGHGMAAGDRYYLVPHDIGTAESVDNDRDAILARGISDLELEAGFEGIDAGEILLIIDACQSGQALEAEESRRGPMNSRGIAQLAYEKGMHVLAAAQSYQAALEFQKLGHGLLTYTLLQGLNGMSADNSPRDQRLTAPEWLDYAIQHVPEETDKALARYAERVGRGIEVVESTTTGQAPRAYFRRDVSNEPWVVAVP